MNKLSTTTALIQMMDSISEATDANQMSATMCTDHSAAFDCIKHSTLKNKLKLFGLDKITLDWIRLYLDTRSFYIVIGSAQSKIISTNHRVPQGSVLGPLLYLVYVNELPSVIEDDH